MTEYVAALEQFERRATIRKDSTTTSTSADLKRLVYGDYEFSTVDKPRDPEVDTLHVFRDMKESELKLKRLDPYVVLKEECSGCEPTV